MTSSLRSLPDVLTRANATLTRAPYPDGCNAGYRATATDGSDLGWVRIDGGATCVVIDYDGVFKKRPGGARYAIRSFDSLDAAADFVSTVLAPELVAGRKVPAPRERIALPPRSQPSKYGHAEALARAAAQALADAEIDGWTAVVNGESADDDFDESTDDEVIFVDALGHIHPVRLQSGPFGHGANLMMYDELGDLRASKELFRTTPARFPASAFVEAILLNAPGP